MIILQDIYFLKESWKNWIFNSNVFMELKDPIYKDTLYYLSWNKMKLEA